MTKRRPPRRNKKSRKQLSLASRHLWHETLEKRELLAADIEGAPRLIGVNPDAEEIFSEDTLNELNASPNQLTFRFDGGQQLDPNTLSGIRIVGSGGDDIFGNGNDLEIIPGFLGFGANQQTVEARFSQSLADDRYRVVISGEDDTNNGVLALRNVDGLPFRTIDNQTIQNIDFDVELGGQVIAVVPQPVDPIDGVLTRADDKIDVYFDDADLFRPGSNIETPEFYQLVDTNGTVTTEDDTPITPSGVTADPVLKKVTLDFGGVALEDLVAGNTRTSFRLRVGSDSDFELLAVTPFTPPTEPGIVIGEATDLAPAIGGADSWTLLIDQTISNGALTALADNPGNNDEPGHRDIETLLDGGDERHVAEVGDSDNAIEQIEYTFLLNESYGNDVNGIPLFNDMNDEQEQRFREILEIYGDLLGIDFVETENSGLELIVGDLFTAGDTSGPGGTLGLGSPARVTMDFADYTTAESNEFGGSFFDVAIHEIGHALEFNHQYDLIGAVMGNGTIDNVFPSPHDIVHGEFLYQKEALDVDLYELVLTDPGTLTAQTIAERLPNASLLDTRLTIFQQNADGVVFELTANDDYFGSDSFVEISLDPGTYFVGVSAEGNNTYDIESGLTSPGGVSEGDYNLRLEFKSDVTINTIVDADGSRLDGDRDGIAGGNYSFWFDVTDAAHTLYVRKPDIASDVGGTGTLAAPLDNIDDALALAAATPNTTIRVIANDGLDNDITDANNVDNQAYEIGFLPGVNRVLDDGRNILLPEDTTLIIDAGAILKFLDAGITVGSDPNGVDRSGASIQVLGTPQLPVYFTSYNDHTRGENSNPNDNTPAPGEWGGIEIRNDVDRAQGREVAELVGIFDNYVNHADIAYGGGQVSVVNRLLAPVHLSEARAEVSFNTISDSGNAAISADPNTFRVTTFVEPRFQRSSQSGNGFVTDYQRIGPDIHGNRLENNDTNGMFVRIDTLPGAELEELRVAARFDDTDIVHVLQDSLLIDGLPGGPFQESASLRPSPIFGLSEEAAGDIAAGTYEYSYTFVDPNGFESLGSVPQGITVTGTGNSIRLTGITLAPRDFVSRRVYRRDNGVGDFNLVAELDIATGVYVDTLAAASASAATLDPSVATMVRGKPDASLVVDPGTIIKSDGARIEIDFGATLVAEGTEGNNVIFTGLADDRYGAGGTFDTNNDSDTSDSVPGEWAGIYANRTSRISIDNARLAYGGGITGVDGTTAGFNVIEVHQAKARIANSVLEFNANGQGGQADNVREGRLENDDAVIYASGAQLTVVGNTFTDNDGPVINIDVNSMDSFLRQDAGRQTGEIDLYPIPPSNNGPIIRGNELDRNAINAMLIRGNILMTEVVWDDTDIVHMLDQNDRVTVTNMHTYNGLRLESSNEESLVVKFDEDAELLASGESLDITDRIGGRIQVLGTPGNPVVLTSIHDCTVGAGFTPDGQPMNDTLNSGLCNVNQNDNVPYVDVIVILDEAATMGATHTFSEQLIVDLEANLLAQGIGVTGGSNRYGGVAFGGGTGLGNTGRALSLPSGNFGTAAQYAAAASSQLVTSGTGTTSDGYAAIDFALNNFALRPEAGKIFVLATDNPRAVENPALSLATTMADLDAAGVRLHGILAADIENDGGDVALAIDENLVYFESGGAVATETGGMVVAGVGVPDYLGLVQASPGTAGDITRIGGPVQTQNNFRSALVDSISSQVSAPVAPAGTPGDWQGITLDPYSHDRNLDTTSELEGDIRGSGDRNSVIGGHQPLGLLAPNEFSGDDNSRLGFTVFGAIAADNDQDIYSFDGTAGTMVWIDIDRTDAGLDTVLEFLDGDGNVLALSENSRKESVNGELTFVNPRDVAAGDDIGFDPGHALPMQLDPDAKLNAQGGGHRDLYSINEGDSGMRVVLPGVPGSKGTFFVRVRSSNARDLSIPSEIVASLDEGFTTGGYQLQIRMQETDEIGGSIIRGADIRYATIGINTIGLPAHSPLAGEVLNNVGTGTVDLGGVTNTDRAAISASGGLAADGGPSGAPDSFQFTVFRDDLQTFDDDNSVSVTIDVDYADGLSRANYGAYLYHDGQLVAIGTDSNVLDDQAVPRIPNQVDSAILNQLSNGSFGPADPYIGPLELSTIGSYEVVVVNNTQIPPELRQFTDSNPANSLVRLEPLDSTVRISDDRFGAPDPTAEQGPVDLQVAFAGDGSNAIPWHIGDVPLIGLTNNRRLSIYNPFTGRHDAIINDGPSFGSMAQDSSGDILAVAQGSLNNADIFSINADGSNTDVGGTAIQTFQHDDNGDADPTTNNNVTSAQGVEFTSLAFFNSQFMYGLAHRDNFVGINVIHDANGADQVGGPVPQTNVRNLIYRLDPNNGTVISRGGVDMPAGFEAADPKDPQLAQITVPAETPWAGTNKIAQIQIPTTNGDVVDLVADINGTRTLFAFTNDGSIWRMGFGGNGDINGNATLFSNAGGGGGIRDEAGNLIIFEQVTIGPNGYQSADEDQGERNLYYGVGNAGNGRSLYAFTLGGATARRVFHYGESRVSISSNGSFDGLFFSSLDSNSWRVSGANGAEPGHGMPALDNDARPSIAGGNSLHFGMGADGYNVLGGAHGSVQSNSLDLSGIVAADQPTLYFNYLLDTEDFNGTAMRDSLRVFVSGDDSEWSLVATNNFNADVSSGGFDFVGTTREYDPVNSNYTSQEEQRFVQQLFDTDGFRQARIDLGPWAGNEDVRVRFEFSTAGESRHDQSEIVAIPGDMITDGHTITLSGMMADKTTPTGSGLANLNKVFEFDVAGNGITTAGAIAIPINPTDTAQQVRDKIQQAFANEIRYSDSLMIGGGNFTVNSFPTAGDGVQVYDLVIAQNNPGPKGRDFPLVLGSSNQADPNLPINSNFGVYGGSLFQAGRRSVGLGGSKGINIDDVIIGLAERGESVGNAGNATPLTNLTSNPLSEATFAGESNAEITVGPFQVEIRTSREYADPATQRTGSLDKLPDGRVQPNQRLATGLNLTVTDVGANIADGDTFTISNGSDTLTFEFDKNGGVNTAGNLAVEIDDADFVGEVASAIRDAINTISVNAVLGIIATNRGGQLVTLPGVGGPSPETDPVIAIQGFAAANFLGGLDFGPHLSAEIVGDDDLRGEDNGDRNRRRDQGQLIIDSNAVSFSEEFGIVVDAGATTPSAFKTDPDNEEGDRPKPGAVIQFPTRNTAEQIPGAVVRNNLLFRNSDGGIKISGDTSNGAPSSFARVLNNTVFGSMVGIEVSDQIAPALLNNVLMNNSTGLQLVNNSETLIRGTVFEGNATVVTPAGNVGTEALINPGVQLFVNPNPFGFDPAGGSPNFYPVEGSPLINNSISSQNDRTQLESVKEVIGLPPSPILSPEFDLYGQSRGEFFADQGAIDRLDDVGPLAELLRPLDNDVDNIDADPRETVVQLTEGRQFFFDIVLNDGTGTGTDASSVTPDQVALVENGRLLTSGEDYVIGYSATNNILRLTPTSGEWRPDSVYVITLNNQTQLRIDTVDGSQISDGDQVRFTDKLGNQTIVEYDSGNSLQVPQTLALRVSDANSGFTDGDRIRITAPGGAPTRTFEINTAGTVRAGSIPIDLTSAGTIAEVRQAILDTLAVFESELDLVLTPVDDDIIQLGTLPGHLLAELPQNAALTGFSTFGQAAGIEDGQQFSYTNQFGSVTFTFTSTPTVPEDIPFSRSDTPDEIAAAIAAAVAQQNLGLTSARAVGDGVVALGGTPDDVFDPLTSALTQISQAGVQGKLTLTVPLTETPASLEGDAFTVTVGGNTQVFRFTTDPVVPIVGNRVLLQPFDGPDEIATAIANTLDSVFGAALSPTTEGNVVFVGEQDAITGGAPQVLTSVDVSGTTLVEGGISGGAIPVAFFPTSQFSEAATAIALSQAIRLSPLQTEVVLPGGGIMLLDGIVNALNITPAGFSLLGSSVSAITDLAGNPLLANQDDGSTRFTIVMFDVELDYGDAPDSYQTLATDNGARHAIVRGGTPRLGAFVDAEADADIVGTDDRPIDLNATTTSTILNVTVSENAVQELIEVDVSTPASDPGGDRLTVTLDGTDFIFELVSQNTAPSAGTIVVPIVSPATAAEIAASFVATINATLEETRDSLIVTIDPTDDTAFSILAIDDEDGLPVGFFDGDNDGMLGGSDTVGLFLADASTGTTADAGDVIGFLNRSPEDNRTIVPITVSGNGLLSGWIDFNGNGVFTDPLEHVFDNVPVIDGVNMLEIVTPLTATLGLTHARFRLSTAGSDSFVGIANDGEVEDYQLQIFDIDVPDIFDDMYSVDEDMMLTVNAANGLFANDDQLPPTVDFVELQYTIVAQPMPDPDDPNDPTKVVYPTNHGFVRILDSAAGTFQYVPEPDYYGPDEFVYFVTTQRNVTGGNPDLATVSITVDPVNDAPGLQSDTFLFTTEDVAGGFVISRDDLRTLALPDATPMGQGFPQDESNQVLNVSSVSTPFGTIDSSNETASIMTSRRGVITALFTDGPGGTRVIEQLTYIPELNFNSQNFNGTTPPPGTFFDDGFEFTVVDDGISLDAVDPVNGTPQMDGPLTATANINIRVTPQNDAPELATEIVDAADQDFQDFFGAGAPGPTEDATFIFTSAYLLDNDLEGPSGMIVGTNVVGRTEDEISNYDRGDGVLNDGPLSINPSPFAVRLIDPSQGSISYDIFTGDITFTPADDIFGEVLFEYDVIDQGIDQPAILDPTGNGVTDLVFPVPNPLISTITSTIVLEPVNDVPITVDRAFNVDEVVETNPLSGQPPAQIVLTPRPAPDAVPILVGSASDTLNPTVNVTASDITLSAPFNEDNQNLEITRITVEGVDSVGTPGTPVTDTLTTASGGTLEVSFDASGFLVQAVYTPPRDYNSTAPFFVPADTFTYEVTDDGTHEFPVGTPFRPKAGEESLVDGTVTLTVNPMNDLPVFDMPLEIDILEDDPVSSFIPNFFTNVAGGPDTALDELPPEQDVSFSVVQLAGPTDLMTMLPAVPSDLTDSSIRFFPAPDMFGTVVYAITATDTGSPNQSFSQILTVNVRPVNDAPRFGGPIAPDMLDDDTAYSVANIDTNFDGLLEDATITYTLREDNTQRLADSVAPEPFFIPLRQGTDPGYQQLGLLDVFTVGPGNESDPLPGGSQILELLDFGRQVAGGTFVTDLGGILESVFESTVLIGLNYTPPRDFNNAIGGFDSFSYTVIDDSTFGTGGETFDLPARTLVADRLTATNRVRLNLNPVNDRPVFSTSTLDIEVPEDSNPIDFPNFAFNVNAASPSSAFDEVDNLTGQTVSFRLTLLNQPGADVTDFFSEVPTIDPLSGTLSFQPAPDVFGDFQFEVVLLDDGDGDEMGDNPRGDINASLASVLTLRVRPTNDLPRIDPSVPPLDFVMLEDGSFEILVRGDNTSPGLLDVFTPGPDNESADILPNPGGNQTISLRQPVPVSSGEGGTITPVLDPNTNEIIKLVYRPRPNFVGMDSFIYTVIDDGSSVRLGTGGVPFSDPRFASNAVTFNVLPVNDAPQFSGAGNVTSDEDQLDDVDGIIDGRVTFTDWANNVQAGPVTALDEINGTLALPPQSLEFVFTQLTSNTDLFEIPPQATINGTSATLTYKTAQDLSGTAVFEVFLRDNGPSDASNGDRFESVPTTFAITVNPINDPPTFTPGTVDPVLEDSGPYSEQWATNISAGPPDESDQSVQFVVTTPPEFASLFQAEPTISDSGVLRFTPATNKNTDNPLGPAQISVVAIDSAGGQTSPPVILEIVITEVNDPPVAVPDPINTDEDTVLTITAAQLLANDIDPDLDSNVNEKLTIAGIPEFSISGARITPNIVNGEIVSVTYDPTEAVALKSLAPNETLNDSFSYRAVDAMGVSSGLVTVGLTVAGINDAPDVVDDEVDLAPVGDTIILPLANDVDFDGTIDVNSILITLQPAFGSILFGDNGTLIYTPFRSFPEVDVFRYTVADNLGDRSEEALVTISANSAPQAFDDARGTFLDEAVDIDVAANDIDPDGQLDLNSIVIIDQPARGQAVPKAGGIVQYLPEPGFLGRDSFTYQIFDTEGRGSNIATVDTQVVASRLQNPDLITDVNDDGFTTALDALLIINHLKRNPGLSIPVLPDDRGPDFYDVNGNQSITAGDAIVVINALSRQNVSGELVVPLVETETGTDLGSSFAPELGPELVADEPDVVDAGAPVDDDLINLIAIERDGDEDEEETTAAVDAAMADLL